MQDYFPWTRRHRGDWAMLAVRVVVEWWSPVFVTFLACYSPP